MKATDVARPVSSELRFFPIWIRTVAALILTSIVCSPAWAERKILQNDSFSGSATFTQLAAFDEQEIVAATFTADPGDYPYRIENVQVLVLAVLPATIAFVSATVWEELGIVTPGPPIFTSSYGYQVESSVTEINQLSLSCEDIVITDGSIRVGLTWEAIGDTIGVAFDLDGITPTTNFVYSAPLGGWFYSETLSVTGDWIIRLEIETNIGADNVFTDGFERGDSSCWLN